MRVIRESFVVRQGEVLRQRQAVEEECLKLRNERARFEELKQAEKVRVIAEREQIREEKERLERMRERLEE